jgi:hypothetical protein
MDAGTTDRNEVLFGQGIDNHQCFVVRRGLAKRGPQLMGSSVNCRPWYEPERRASQRRMSGSVMGLRGWLLKPGFIEETITNEEVSAINRSTDRGRGRANNHVLCA